MNYINQKNKNNKWIYKKIAAMSSQIPSSINERDEYPGADAMNGLRRSRIPNPARIARRAARREAMQQFRESQVRNLFANPGNIFMNPEPMPPMQRPVSPVRQQPPNPQSRRQRRKASRRQKEQRASRIASGWIYGGAKTKRRRRR